MRELSSHEMTIVSAGEKAIFELTPSDLLPYGASAFCALWLSNTLSKAASACSVGFINGSFGVLGGSAVGLVVGAVGGFFTAKYATEHCLQPYL